MRVRPASALAPLLCAGLVVTACGSDGTTGGAASTAASTGPTASSAVTAPESVQHLEVEAVDYRFTFDPPVEEVVAGWTSLTLRNEGAEAHQVMFARLKDGVDLAELSAAAGDDSSGAAAIAYVDMIGGVSYIGPGQEITAMVDLPEGTVMAMCYVPDAHGVAHALMGMSTLLEVGAATDDGADAVEATVGEGEGPDGGAVEGTIEMTADGYRLPEELSTGWYRVVNADTGVDGEGLHELSILRLDEPVPPGEVDALMQDLAANESPAVALDALGGMGALSPGFEGYLYLDLPAGDYVAVDFMPDPGEPQPHLLEGYYAAFQP